MNQYKFEDCIVIVEQWNRWSWYASVYNEITHEPLWGIIKQTKSMAVDYCRVWIEVIRKKDNF